MQWLKAELGVSETYWQDTLKIHSKNCNPRLVSINPSLVVQAERRWCCAVEIFRRDGPTLQIQA